MCGPAQTGTGTVLGMLCYEHRSALAPIFYNPVLYYGALAMFTSATDAFTLI
jgi:hypothetical protein